MKFSLLSSLFFACNLMLSGTVIAQEFSQSTNEHAAHEHEDITALGSHVHGHAILTIVLEGNEMQLAFQAAAQSVVGFEHKPVTAEQQQEITAAIVVFNQAAWFSFNADANCELAQAEASTDLTQLHTKQGHADFYANYALLCQRPAKLNELQLHIFNLIPSLENINVQWIINAQQGAANTTFGNSTIKF